MISNAWLVPRMLGDHGQQRPVHLTDIEHWIASGATTDVTDQVVTLLVLAAADHERSGRRTLAASLRQHAAELLHPPGSKDSVLGPLR